MQRFALIFLLIGTVMGLTLQAPVAAGAVTSAMTPGHAAMAGAADATSMPDCMASSTSHAGHKPCDCGMAGCVASLTSGPAMMLANGPALRVMAAPSDRDDRIGATAALHGRSTAPEPEPPSVLI